MRLMNDLRAAGWRVAVVDGAVVMLYHGSAWQVVGGTPQAPTMKRRADLDAKVIRWSA